MSYILRSASFIASAFVSLSALHAEGISGPIVIKGKGSVSGRVVEMSAWSPDSKAVPVEISAGGSTFMSLFSRTGERLENEVFGVPSDGVYRFLNGEKTAVLMILEKDLKETFVKSNAALPVLQVLGISCEQEVPADQMALRQACQYAQALASKENPTPQELVVASLSLEYGHIVKLPAVRNLTANGFVAFIDKETSTIQTEDMPYSVANRDATHHGDERVSEDAQPAAVPSRH
ncbi:MAG: hypothetical protein ABIR96_11840 [Bdellovibrionota bacterium]